MMMSLRGSIYREMRLLCVVVAVSRKGGLLDEGNLISVIDYLFVVGWKHELSQNSGVKQLRVQ